MNPPTASTRTSLPRDSARYTHTADDLDGGWGAPGGIDAGDLATVAGLHLPQLLALAAALTGDPRSAGDAVTAVVARLPAAGSGALTGRPDLRLRRLLLREHRSRRPRRRRNAASLPQAVRHRKGRTAPDPLWAALDGLPRRSRVVLVLRYHQHLSDEEIAAVIGRRPAVVRARAARGLTALRATTTNAPAPAPTTEEPQ